jgi:hypothetical protein
MIKYHIQDPDRQNGHKNIYTSRRAELITCRTKRISPWKERKQGLINIKSNTGGLQDGEGGLNTAWVEYQKASDSVPHSWVKNK